MKHIRNWKISLPIAGIVLAGLAWLAFGFFGIHTAFIDDEVSEAAPVFDAPAEPIDATPDVKPKRTRRTSPTPQKPSPTQLSSPPAPTSP